MKKSALFGVALLCASSAAVAAPAGQVQGLYFGGGLSANSASGTDTGIGYQFFGGYELPVKTDPIKLAVEVGYMDSGDLIDGVDSNATGLWATGVGVFAVNSTVNLLVRAGFDFGDDDGFMFGVGAGFNLNKQMELRAELVERDNIESFQVNFLYRL